MVTTKTNLFIYSWSNAGRPNKYRMPHFIFPRWWIFNFSYTFGTVCGQWAHLPTVFLAHNSVNSCTYRDSWAAMACAKLWLDVIIIVQVITPSVFRRTLQGRHNGPDSVSNHQPHDSLLNRLFRRRSKKTSKLCVTGLCAGNSLETGEFPAQMASNAEKATIWLRRHDWIWTHRASGK